MLLVNNCLESIIILVSGYLVAKYIFLEKGFSEKLDRRLVHIAFVLVLLGECLGYHDVVTVMIVLGLMGWIFAGRTEHRVCGMLLAFPIIGIVDGLLLPIAVIPQKILEIGDAIYKYYKLGLYVVVLFSLAFLWIHLGKVNPKHKDELRDKLGKSLDLQSHNRKLSHLELFFLCFIGIFELVFSMILASGIDHYISGSVSVEEITKWYIVLMSICTLIMPIVVMILVMSNNKRTFYHDKVSDMQFNIIVMMAEIVQNRDADTGGHIHRTAKYVEIITKQLKKESPYQELITDQFAEDIKVAAPLHDIGKIHVSDTILNCPGRLTEEQFAIMKTHAEEGRKLLIHTKEHIGEFSYLDMAIDMAGAHHEWWDGSAKGYPDHKKGEEIPLCARIMAVADVFDALTAERVYKKAMPCEKAIGIIVEEKGTHFDPVIVDAFLDTIEEIRTALDEFEAGEKDEETSSCIQVY